MGVATPTVLASRFDPPWQSRVVVDQTTLYRQADRGSAPVGPLSRGQVVVVAKELTGRDGKPWPQVPDGSASSSDVAEATTPWTAPGRGPRPSVYGPPRATEPSRRPAQQ